MSKLLIDDEEELPDLDLADLMNEKLSDEDDDDQDHGKNEDETTIGDEKSLGVGSTRISCEDYDDDQEDDSENDADELEDDCPRVTRTASISSTGYRSWNWSWKS